MLCEAYAVSFLRLSLVSRGLSIRGANMIKKVKEGYKVVSEKGKNLGGPYKSKQDAKKRLRQVEFFKHRKNSR